MAGFFKNLYNKVSNRADVDWDELEAELIAADLGVRTSLEIVESCTARGRGKDNRGGVSAPLVHCEDGIVQKPKTCCV